MKFNKLLTVLTVWLLFSALFLGTPSYASTGDKVKAADFELTDLNGEKVKLSDYRGKVIILDFWATWCPPCVKEIPHFNELVKDYADLDFAVLGVSVDEDGVKAVNKFKKKNSLDYTVALNTREVYNQYQSYLPKEQRGGIPFTFVIDKNGYIRDYYVGYRPKSVFEEAIKPLFKESVSAIPQ